MAKSKRGPALFELLKSSEGENAVGRAAPDAPAGDQPPDRTAPVSPDLPHTPSGTAMPPGSAEAVRSEAGSARKAACEVDGQRIRLSLTQGTATIAAAAVVLVMIGVGYLSYRVGEERGKEKGRLAIQEPVLDDIEQARRDLVTRNLFDGIGNDPTGAVGGPTGEPTLRGPASPVPEAYDTAEVPWVPGHNYIVVQDFKNDARGDAVRAQGFLEENGVQAAILELERSGAYGYRLVTTTGFNLDDPVQKRLADEYLERVRRIGRAYSESGGRYDFQSAYLKKLPGDHW